MMHLSITAIFQAIIVLQLLYLQCDSGYIATMNCDCDNYCHE